MVNDTSSQLIALRAEVDRYRPVRSVSPVVGAVTGEVCPLALDRGMTMSAKATASIPAGWQHTTKHNSIVFAGFGFDQVTDDTRVGPPPPRRPSV